MDRLPVSADNQVQVITGQSVLLKLSTLKSCMDDDIASDASMQVHASTAVSINEIEKIQQLVTKWFTALPDTISITMTSAHDINSSPLQRCLARELIKGRSTIASIRTDLELLLAYCRGEVKVSNDIRYLIDCFTKSKVPSKWFISGAATRLSLSRSALERAAKEGDSPVRGAAA